MAYRFGVVCLEGTRVDNFLYIAFASGWVAVCLKWSKSMHRYGVFA